MRKNGNQGVVGASHARSAAIYPLLFIRCY